MVSADLDRVSRDKVKVKVKKTTVKLCGKLKPYIRKLIKENAL